MAIDRMPFSQCFFLYMQDKHKIGYSMEIATYAESRGFSEIWQADTRRRATANHDGAFCSHQSPALWHGRAADLDAEPGRDRRYLEHDVGLAAGVGDGKGPG